MTLVQTIFIVIASLMLVKGVIICLIPRQMIALTKPFVKNEKAMRRGGLMGIAGAIIVFILANLF